MKRSNRLVWLGAIALLVIIVLTSLSAPSNTKLNSGSTYSHAPDGYGAWYAFMQQRGTSIKRWQKPMGDLTLEKRPATLLQINSYLQEPEIDYREQEWLEQGNNLVILGVREKVTAANFSTLQKSSTGDVKIETRRRRSLKPEEKILLGDRFGAVVWEVKRGQGKVVFATTPFLAANAYQDNLSNFNYLADLVRKKGNIVFVDEYMHGYKDADVKESEGKGDIFSYLTKTPLFPMFLQTGVLLLVLIWAQNSPFGKPIGLKTPEIDNSQAYIQALAGVLQKAESSDFVVEMLGKEEQLQLQKALGLGQVLVDSQTLVNAWVQQTSKSGAELEEVLKLQSRKSRMNEQELLSWLEKWQNLRIIKN